MKIKYIINELTPNYINNNGAINISELDDQRFDDCDYIVDLSVSNTFEKLALTEMLKDITDNKLIVDTSTSWGDKIALQENVSGCLAACFYSPKNTYETTINDQALLKKLSEDLNIDFKTVSSAGICFTYPRTVSMIINEAFFSLEDEMATPEDIDTAMKFGVNYPLGPFEWSEKIGREIIQNVLDDLYGITGDPRYRASIKLQL
ncbi:MAG: hypothetical protein GY909_08045 [Oligoflexia bacterium]|nr:hypothetical protein [Oligoflexia bacterium]